MGLERVLIQWLRPAGGRRQWLDLLPRPRGARQLGLCAVAARPAPPVRAYDAEAGPRRFLSTLLPAEWGVWERHLDDDATAAQPLDPFALGSQLRRRELDQRQGHAHSAHEELGFGLLPRSPDSHHGAQLVCRSAHD